MCSFSDVQLTVTNNDALILLVETRELVYLETLSDGFLTAHMLGANEFSNQTIQIRPHL
jgi:hypothetical protein